MWISSTNVCRLAITSTSMRVPSRRSAGERCRVALYPRTRATLHPLSSGKPDCSIWRAAATACADDAEQQLLEREAAGCETNSGGSTRRRRRWPAGHSQPIAHHASPPTHTLEPPPARTWTKGQSHPFCPWTVPLRSAARSVVITCPHDEVDDVLGAAVRQRHASATVSIAMHDRTTIAEDRPLQPNLRTGGA